MVSRQTEPVSTGYAIIRTNRLSDHHPEVTVVQVVWREEQAGRW
jgi:hypothetical protein